MSELFDDVKAADALVLSKDLVLDSRGEPSSSQDVAAIEEGRRVQRDGTVVEYRRVEFRQQ